MKILHILNELYQGGIRSLLIEMVKFQIQTGNEVSILCLIKDPEFYKNISEFENMGAKIIKGSYDNPYNPLNIFPVKKHLKNYDIVHIHHFPNQLYAKIAYILTPKKNRPGFITTEHSTYNNRRKYPILRYIDRWFYRSYDSIVGISEPTTRNLQRWLNSSKLQDKITTITNGININKFKDAENKIHQVLKLTPDSRRKYVVMVSRMEYPKDPLTLVRSTKYFTKDVHLVFVGSGDLCSQIIEEANRLNISDRVHVLGNRADIPEILKGCDVGVLSTKWEGFGLVAAEYMAAGLPVIVTDVEGLRDVVEETDSLFNYQDSETLGKKINRLLTDENYRKRKQAHSLSQGQKYSVDLMNQKYLSLYNRCRKKDNESI